MELPEDILAIVLAYAKPRFTYFREYNGITKLLGREWPALKEKLQTDPEPILPAVLAYQSALSSQSEFNRDRVSSAIRDRFSSAINFIQYMDARRTLYFPQNWGKERILYKRGVYLRNDAEDRFRELNRLLVKNGAFPFL